MNETETRNSRFLVLFLLCFHDILAPMNGCMFNSIAVYAIRIRSTEYVNNSPYCSGIAYEFHVRIWFGISTVFVVA